VRPFTVFSIEAWIKPAHFRTTSGGGMIWALPGANYIELAEGGRIRVYCYGTAPSGYHYSNGRVSLEAPSHVAYVWDGSGHNIYINGQLDRRIPASGQPRLDTRHNVDIGTHAISTSYKWYGKIYILRYYNEYALTSEDIRMRYGWDVMRFEKVSNIADEQKEHGIQWDFEPSLLIRWD
jgi:hypothetical protein